MSSDRMSDCYLLCPAFSICSCALIHSDSIVMDEHNIWAYTHIKQQSVVRCYNKVDAVHIVDTLANRHICMCFFKPNWCIWRQSVSSHNRERARMCVTMHISTLFLLIFNFSAAARGLSVVAVGDAGCEERKDSQLQRKPRKSVCVWEGGHLSQQLHHWS